MASMKEDESAKQEGQRVHMQNGEPMSYGLGKVLLTLAARLSTRIGMTTTARQFSTSKIDRCT